MIFSRPNLFTFFRTAFLKAILLLGLCGCAILHKVQLSDIDNRSQFVQVPFDVKVSETGVDVKDIERLGRASGSQAGNDIGNVAALVALFQMGPRSGAPVFSEKYAEKIIYQIHQQCPSGNYSGVTSIRETRKYPVISGEIVKVTGFCLREKKGASL